MNKRILFCLTLSFLTSVSCFAESGNVLICASGDNEVKMTADLSDGKGEKIAVATLEGIPHVFPEIRHNQLKNQISFYPNKNTPLVVTSLKKKTAEITLTVNPESSKLQVIHEVSEPSPLKISKFVAMLTVPAIQIHDQEVTCTETKWRN